MGFKMNTKNCFAKGIAAVICVNAALADVTIDNFDTFLSPKGWDLTSSGAQVVDGPEIVTKPSDTDFTNLVRRAYLGHAGVGDASFNNINAVLGNRFAAWSNDVGVQSAAILRYDFSSAQNFGLAGQNLNQIDLEFYSSDAAGSIYIEVFSTSSAANVVAGGGAKLAGTLSIANGASGLQSFDVDNLLPANGGSSAIWDSARVIRFTLTTSSSFGTDGSFDNIGLSNPSVPEAETMIPVISFAGLAGFMAWRRRAAK
jgi:hypothetical protein